jgi:hypothetical protein
MMLKQRHWIGLPIKNAARLLGYAWDFMCIGQALDLWTTLPFSSHHDEDNMKTSSVSTCSLDGLLMNLDANLTSPVLESFHGFLASPVIPPPGFYPSRR